MIARMGLSTYARLMRGAGPCAVGSIHMHERGARAHAVHCLSGLCAGILRE
uniref:Uncharacterized protein n=1 Tax=Manihot esculenta TaxID=3983 RepID=A0A2C9WK07_MANES